ncbi:Uncharacterised protein [Klebsiella oxytoca]|nr:hypothetical protein HMPREF9692_01027 [Klebsiella oxytoca 10-5248]CAF9405967.1 hypothetical protein AI2918V1_1481 [Klebsiella oxytoca]CAH5421330.1 hypothetical protein AI2991V1_0135 [Klebsiella oxytoca]CAH5863343.1 hypothetical protein AI2918V1_1481 [Klebsiella oxytoca]SAQ23839.1 Uncharacterised protein [Klebsiella oxytoca]
MAITELRNQTFENELIVLDLHSYTNCKFVKCKMVYSGFSDVMLVENDFYNCEWHFTGPASNTLNFLRLFYNKMGEPGKKIVEDTFDNIRSPMSK